MSFEVIAPGNYENRQSEDAKQKRTGVPSGPPPATISVQNISEKMDELGDEWVQLSESGPEHAHAPVHVPNKMLNTVLKEYSLNERDVAVREAELTNAASGYMPKVYGVYEDTTKQLVYIHMEKLHETVMARIQENGAYFLLQDLEKDKFDNLWNMTKLFDNDSMCRVDNMMYGNDDKLYFIDAEKATIVPDDIKADARISMKKCFLASAVKAHLYYLATKKEVDLYEMGRLYEATGGRLSGGRWLVRNVKRKLGESILEWIDKGYEKAYTTLLNEGLSLMGKLYEKYGLKNPPTSLNMKTTFRQKGNSFITVRLVTLSDY